MLVSVCVWGVMIAGHRQTSMALNISTSSCRATGMDIPDPLSPLLPIVHRLRQVFRATPYMFPHIAAGCMFVLVVLLSPRHIWGSIGVHNL